MEKCAREAPRGRPLAASAPSIDGIGVLAGIDAGVRTPTGTAQRVNSKARSGSGERYGLWRAIGRSLGEPRALPQQLDGHSSPSYRHAANCVERPGMPSCVQSVLKWHWRSSGEEAGHGTRDARRNVLGVRGGIQWPARCPDGRGVGAHREVQRPHDADKPLLPVSLEGLKDSVRSSPRSGRVVLHRALNKMALAARVASKLPPPRRSGRPVAFGQTPGPLAAQRQEQSSRGCRISGWSELDASC